jgi:hypothetical protein
MCVCYRDSREGVDADLALRADPSTSGRCTRFDVKLPPLAQAPAPVDDRARAERFADDCRARGIELAYSADE